MGKELTFSVGVPPSTNNAYYSGRSGGRYLTREGREFKRLVGDMARVIAASERWMVPERIAVRLMLHFPNRRRRDIDNCLKLVLDAVSDALGFDDSRIDEIKVIRGEPKGEDAHAVLTLYEPQKTAI